MATIPQTAVPATAWLRTYYLARAATAVAWVALAVTIGTRDPLAAAFLLIAYPTYDAIANWVDQRKSGQRGLSSQAVNIVVSLVCAVAVVAALGQGMHAVLGVFGVWAFLAGLLQLATGVRRWRIAGAQWAMILSGAQSALAGGFMLTRALGEKMPSIADIAPYAAFGAFYFLVSGLWLAVRPGRTA
jgi:uncharacterized membrane protein HdeD (DUF308 family)